MAAHVNGARDRLDHLDRSVLAKAFRGGLVETEAERARREGRDYETAAELLQRVRGEETGSESDAPQKKQTRTVQNGQLEMEIVKGGAEL